MNFKLSGQNWTKEKKLKVFKLVIAFLLSNVFFFLLFAGKSEVAALPEGMVEMRLQAQLLTPFEVNKKILLVNRRLGKGIVALLKGSPSPDGLWTVGVQESEAVFLLQGDAWEILPYIKTISLARPQKKLGDNHEIRY